MKVQNDKIQHFGVCLVCAMCISFICAVMSEDAPTAMFAGVSSALALGVGKEYGDCKAINNTWDWYDIIADAFGALCGSCAGLIALLL